MLPIRSSGLFVLIIVLITSLGCASKKKATKAAAAEKARIEREDAERKLKAQEEELARKEAEEKARREAEELLAKQNESRTSTPAVKLEQYFSSIASSSNTTSANTSINEALTLFASPNAPVLIVISESGGIKDYDRPTTIRDYLNYLKDQKKNINAVSNLKTDSQGKITELELRKN